MCLGARSRENGEGQQSELEEFENIPLSPDRLVPSPDLVCLGDRVNEDLKGVLAFC